MAGARERLEQLKEEYGFREPNRGDLDDPYIEWRTGKPDYELANLQYFLGKTQDHQAGKLLKLLPARTS